MLTQYVMIRVRSEIPLLLCPLMNRNPHVDYLRYRSKNYGMTYEMTSTAPALLFSAMKVIRVSTTLLIPYVSGDD